MTDFEVTVEDLERSADFISNHALVGDPGQVGWHNQAFLHLYESTGAEHDATAGGGVVPRPEWLWTAFPRDYPETRVAGSLYDTFAANYAYLRSSFNDTLSATADNLQRAADALREAARRYRATDNHAASHLLAISDVSDAGRNS